MISYPSYLLIFASHETHSKVHFLQSCLVNRIYRIDMFWWTSTNSYKGSTHSLQLWAISMVGHRIKAWKHYFFLSSAGSCDSSSTWRQTSSFWLPDPRPRRTSNVRRVAPWRCHRSSFVEPPLDSLQRSTCKSQSKQVTNGWKNPRQWDMAVR